MSTHTEVGCLTSDFSLVSSDVSLAPVVLNHMDEDGTRWLLTDIEGWWTLPPPSLLDIPRPQRQDGSYDVVGNYLARIVTVHGSILPGNSSLVAAKRSQLLRVLDTVRGDSLRIVANENPPKMAYARLSDQPSISTTKQNGQTDFQVVLKCIDPRKYSVAESEGMVRTFGVTSVGRTYSLTFNRMYGDASLGAAGQLNAVNIGTVPTPPAIWLFGPLTSPSILNFTTSQTLSFPGLVILDGEILVIDVQEHSAVLGTAQRVSYLAHDSVWWWLQPGLNIVRLLAESGSGTMLFSWRSAWME